MITSITPALGPTATVVAAPYAPAGQIISGTSVTPQTIPIPLAPPNPLYPAYTWEIEETNIGFASACACARRAGRQCRHYHVDRGHHHRVGRDERYGSNRSCQRIWPAHCLEYQRYRPAGIDRASGTCWNAGSHWTGVGDRWERHNRRFTYLQRRADFHVYAGAGHHSRQR